jgi:galactonate dehydratase
MLDLHGRFRVDVACSVVRALAPYAPAFVEEPVAWEKVSVLSEVRRCADVPLAAGERLYMLADLARLMETRAVDVVNMDVSHCGGILMGKKIAALAEAHDVVIAPHVSTGPVALAAALQLDMSCCNFFRQENFGEHDVSYRDDLVGGWNPFDDGYFTLADAPGLGLELNDSVVAAHPYKPQRLPSLWDEAWVPGGGWTGE